MTDNEIDIIYDRIDDLLSDGKFNEVDNMLKNLDVNRIDEDEMLSYLTITAAAKNILLNRKAFFEKVKTKLSPEVLSGLE